MPESPTLQPLRLNKPKYVLLAEQIRAQIHAGAYRPGEKLPRVADWKRELGVSLDTMNKVLTVLQQDGLIERSQGSGIYVSQAKPRIKTGSLGFLLHQGGETARVSYWARILEGVRCAAGEAGLEVLLFDPKAEAIRWEKVDGVLAGVSEIGRLRQLIPLTMPCVTLVNSFPELSSVVADEYAGVQAAVRHLVAQGHRRIGYLVMTALPESQLRLAAYHEALREAGIQPDAGLTWRMTGADAAGLVPFMKLGQLNMRAWLHAGFRESGCTALLTQNDETALGVVEVLREAGVKVPYDMSVVGFDGTEVGEFCSPPLTSVAMPLYEMGRQAVELVMEAGRHEGGEYTPRGIVVPTHLLVRETTGAPAEIPASLTRIA